MDRHQFLQFPDTILASRRQRYEDALQIILTRGIEPCISLDWDLVAETELNARLQPFLRKTVTDASGEAVFDCDGWHNIFHISEPIYSELVYEFFSTVTFSASSTDYTERTLQFRLGGQSREISLVEFAWRSGIYSRAQTRSTHFLPFLISSMRSSPEEYREADFWASIANGPYEPQRAKESDIRSPLHRILHRLIACSILHKRGSEKVPTTDLFYLWCLVTPGRHLNLPYALATYLSRKVRPSQHGPLYGGAFITRIAISYAILEPAVLIDLTITQPTFIRYAQLERMRILERPDGQAYRVFRDPAPGVDIPPQRQQRRRQRSPDQQAMPEREIDLRFLADQQQLMMSGLQVHCQWVGNALSGYFAHQGYQPPHPYPSFYPPYPDWYVPHPPAPPATDVAGPSHVRESSESEDD